MAAASGEKDGFPLGPQLFFAFSLARGSADLVQGAPLALIIPFPLHQVSSSFRWRAAPDLVQGTPLTLIIPFPLHQVSSSFRRRATQDLVQGTPLTLITPFPLHQISSSFRWRAAPDLVQGAPLTLIVPCPLHQVPPTFPYCGPSARGFQLPEWVPLIFVYVHKEFVLFCVHGLFFIAFHKFLSII